MTTPRLEIHLDRIFNNARILVKMLSTRGITVTGVTKATLGSSLIARAMLRAGATSIGESRIENIEDMRRAGMDNTMTLIRSPMLGQADRVVAGADISLNSEFAVLESLSLAAKRQLKIHSVILMVELGDLREGILPQDLESIVKRTLRLPNIALLGIGANLGCQNGVAPDSTNMLELSSLAGAIESACGVVCETVSGGNSANIDWAISVENPGRINNLRLGESILLGRETLYRRPIDSLSTDAVTLVAEVIESKIKPAKPWGTIHQGAFGPPSSHFSNDHPARSILALGRQDVDPAGLSAPSGLEILGTSSDHLVLGGPVVLPIGTELKFQLNYSALLQAMTSPFVAQEYISGVI